MLRIPCPVCGAAAEETEFRCGGEAHRRRRAGPGESDEAFAAYLFERENPKGLIFERWVHAAGCGGWFHLARDTRTAELFGTYPIEADEPPAALRERALARLAARGLPERAPF